MDNSDVSNMDDYYKWIGNKFKVDLCSQKNEKIYGTNSLIVHHAIETDIHTEIVSFLQECGEEYKLNSSNFVLYMDAKQTDLELDIKKYPSVCNKSYRYNVIENSNWPKKPNKGWMLPVNWFSMLNDIVRTRIVCKYIDGPKFLAEQLANFIEKRRGFKCRYSSRQREDGYYAYHFYTKIPTVLIIRDEFEQVDVDFEIQITTQLQDVLGQITHKYYEKSRIQRDNDESSWKWDVHSNRFRIGYVSHTLHLMEAMILEVRDNDHISDSK